MDALLLDFNEFAKIHMQAALPVQRFN